MEDFRSEEFKTTFLQLFPHANDILDWLLGEGVINPETMHVRQVRARIDYYRSQGMVTLFARAAAAEEYGYTYDEISRYERYYNRRGEYIGCERYLRD